MRLTKIQLRKGLLLLSTFALLTLSSCSKKEEATSSSTSDFRDEMVGTYTGMEYYTINNGPQLSRTKTVTVSKGSNKSLTLDLGAGLIVNSADLTSASGNSFGNIPTQTVVLGATGDATAIGTGVEGKHIGFTSSSKTINYTIKISQTSTVYDLNFSGKK